ncbi:hypothetical protein [Leuconostoc mesenteroides]|uniref:hypothetical protein n=1 Tax=Leuconostoc mesenteroides TaxID=1245 RepID=UPI000E08FC27|nr:hypothetical protein [Leuconostoc mesenteroides]MCJ2158965.1 hypothetical protein [Leuconostoc mesenteroides]MCM6835610.1 hypothetical protein [Leuconostoc mesenteroides]RDG11619.1 hypothetical protein DQM12_10560 [Leuconostoc mesenteroides subsp. mesenteroides]
MTINDYLIIYANDKSDQYHHLPVPPVAQKITSILAGRFSPKTFDQNRKEMLANKFEVTDAGLEKLLEVITIDDKSFEKIK